MGKETLTQVQEAQRVPYRINPRRNIPKHMLIKLAKIKDKEKTLKAAKEKQQITYKGIPIRLSADFSAETLQARREWHDIFQVMKGNNLQSRILYQQGSHPDSTEKPKLYTQAKAKRIQQHQTSFIPNAKGISLDGKEMATTRSKKITNGKAHQ